MTGARYTRRRRYVSRRRGRHGVRVVRVPGRGVSWRVAVAAVLAGAAAGWWISPARGVPAVELPPCVSDDGSGPRPCVWDATRRGNGAGRSFVVDGSGRVVYVSGGSEWGE